MTFKVIYHSSLTSKQEVNVVLNPDDHVSLVFKKIGAAINKNPNDLYAWTKQKMSKSPITILNFIHNVFKNDKMISANDLAYACLNYFNTSVDVSDYKMLSKDIALKLLQGIDFDHVVQPIGHYFTDAGFLLYFPYNPLKKTKFTGVGSAYNEDMLNMTLQTALGHESSYTIHIVSVDEFTENQELYFPHAGEESNQKKVKKFVSYIQTIEDEFATEIAKDKVSTKSYVNMLFLKSKLVFTDFLPSVDLNILFNSFVTNEFVPFVKYKARTNIYYKVQKGFLASFNDQKELEKWFQLTTFKLQDHSYIVFKVKCRNDKYASVIVADNLSLDIRFNFHVKDEENIDTIHEIFPHINDVIQKIMQVFEIKLLPLLPKRTRDIMQSFDIIRFVTYNVATLGVRAKKEYAEQFARTKMFSYFEIIPDPTHNMLRLQYKKVDNFGKSDNISNFLTRNFTLTKTDAIPKLEELFSLTKEEAENEYEKWELLKDTKAEIADIRFDNYVETKVRFNSPIDVRFVTNGATSLGMMSRISKLIEHILLSSVVKQKESKKDVEAKEIFEQEIKTDIVPSPVSVKSIDADEDDLDDWDAELKALEDEFVIQPKDDIKQIQTNNKTSKLLAFDDEGKVKLKGFVKKMLDSADGDLFSYKSESGKRRDYASLCGWVDRRQPVVITEEEKQHMDKKYPKAYNGYVKTGSTEELEQKHYYICPKVWCPKSRVAIPADMYKEKKDKSCPGENEEPIVFESKSYWGLEDKALDREHFPGFLDKHTRSDGLCLPCCFKLEPKEGNRNKQRQELCVLKSQQQKDKVQEVNVDEVGTEKYIKSDSYFPLEIGRFGLLPKDLHVFLGKNNCGQRHNGTGLMNEKTDCYLRRGIFHGNQSFIHCIISTMDNPNISSYQDFMNLISLKLNIYQFMSLENGKILKLFIDNSRNIYGKDFTEFRTWFLDQTEYITKFNLLKVKKELQGMSKFENIKSSQYKDILREFMIYYSYKNFVEYMNNADIEKDHKILLDFINLSTDWLNIKEYNYVVIDADQRTGKVYIDCSLNRDTRNFVNKKSPFVMLIKQNKYYEPLYYVKTAANEDVQSNYKFSYNDKIHSTVGKILSFYFNNCSSVKQSQLAMEVDMFLESIGYKPKYYVIDYSFRLAGIVLVNNLYIPLEAKRDVYLLRGLRFIYSSDVVTYKCLESKEEIKKVFNQLKEKYGGFYEIRSFLEDDDTLRGVTLKNDTFVPLNVKNSSVLFKDYLDDLYIFTGEQEIDERKSLVSALIEKNDRLSKSIKMIEDKMDVSTRMELMFLQDKGNPIPTDFKRKKLLALLKKYVEKNSQKDMVEIADKFLNMFFDSRKKLVRKFSSAPHEIIFDYNDIQDGKLLEIVEKAKNPYKLFHSKLDDMFDEFVFEEENVANEFSEFINADSTFSDVPAKYGSIQYRKILKSFSVIDNDKNIIYKLIEAASRVTMKVPITINTLKSAIKTNVIKDYKSNNIQDIFDNASFAHHLKKMKLDDPTLDQVLEIMSSMYYRPSIYELKILARLANLNFIVIGRKTLKNPDGIFEVIFTNSPYYIFFMQNFDRKNVVDNFQLIVKNRTDILLSKNDLPTDIILMINNKLANKTM